MRIERAPHFRGTFAPPGDKSISHRLAMLGALAYGDTVLDGYASGNDCASTLGCLKALGVPVEAIDRQVVIHGRGLAAFSDPGQPLDAGNSGSTLRMLSGILAALPFETTITGDASLRQRPVERIAAPLRAMGATATSREGRPPLTIRGGKLHGTTWDSPVASAQVKTAVLFAGLNAAGRTTVREPALSRDHTERLLPLFGVDVQRHGLSVTVSGPARLRAASMRVPGDASSAAFLVVAALTLPDSEVRIENVLLNPTRIAFLDVLREMNGKVEIGLSAAVPEPVGYVTARSSQLAGVTITPERVPALIDEIPALAVAAAQAEGRTVVTGAAELRVKESDRIAALREGLGRMGAQVEEQADGFVIEGGRPLRGARVAALGDHRIAMALAVAALNASGATDIEDAECASVSFPEFYDILATAAR
jgi:3-phosphoshikimate 1-carboxyvinyltransferase